MIPLGSNRFGYEKLIKLLIQRFSYHNHCQVNTLVILACIFINFFEMPKECFKYTNVLYTANLLSTVHFWDPVF